MTIDESLYHSNHPIFSDTVDDNEQAVPTIEYGSVNVKELREEITQKGGKIDYKLKKTGLSNILYTM